MNLCVCSSGDSGLASVTRACSPSDSNPVLCSRRKDHKPSLGAISTYVYPRKQFTKYQRLQVRHWQHIYCFGPPFFDESSWMTFTSPEENIRLELMATLKVEQFPLIFFNIVLAINHLIICSMDLFSVSYIHNALQCVFLFVCFFVMWFVTRDYCVNIATVSMPFSG